MAVLSAGIVTMLGGCEANQLYMGSKTVVGVNAAVSPDQAKGWLVVGYDRTFATTIPRSVDEEPEPGKPPTGKQDAMASLACSRLVVNGVTLKYFKESIATGDAAQIFAKKLHDADGPKTVKDFFDCFKNKPAPGAPTQTAGTDR
jgi:hypothetical protein